MEDYSVAEAAQEERTAAITKNQNTLESEYAQAVGVLREMEKALITRDQWQRAADARDAAEALRLMGGDYGFSGAPEAYEAALHAKLKETYDRLYEICVHSDVVDILNLKYVFHNIKVLVKASVSEYARANGDAILSDISVVSPEVMRGSEKAGCPAYVEEARQHMLAAWEATHDPQTIDMEADRLMFARMLALAEALDNDFILQYVRMQIDLYNLKLTMRAKNMEKGPRFLSSALLPGGLTDTDMMRDAYDKPFEAIATQCYYKYFGDAMRRSEESYAKTKNFSTLEKLADDLLTSHIAQAKYIAFGPEPLFAYIIARENEIRQIRIVATCKINRIADETLRERLRDLYA